MLSACLWMAMISSISTRSPDIWNKVKKEALVAGGFTLDLLMKLATGYIKKMLEDSTGLKL